MTKIIILQSKTGDYQGFLCDGHAGYADYGNDIVCAAISMLVINTINSLEQFTDIKLEISNNEKKGQISCNFCSKPDADAKLLMDSMVLGLQGVVQEYGKKYCELKFKEV